MEKLIQNIYFKIGIPNLNEFKIYIDKKGISYEYVLEKIKIEAIWNEIIVAKFSSKIKIDEDNLREKIKNEKNINTKSYLMSEIFFEIQELNELEKNMQKSKKLFWNKDLKTQL